MDDLSGQVIKGYELRARVGAGGFGAVYRAFQPLVGREVAIKVILPKYANHPDFIRRFEAEAQLVARLEHPHIVPLYDYWREPGGAYLVMRWLRGGSLHDALQAGPWPLDRIAQLLEHVAAALATAHRHRVVHRDLKPANILLDEDSNAYLADFGIAKDLHDSADESLTGMIIGSPGYISPEQIRVEPVTPLADIYSLGVMLYEILAGARPFKTTTPLELLHRHLNEPLPSLAIHRAELPAALDAIIQRATAKRPADRYPDVLSLVADFRRAVATGPLSVVSPPQTTGEGRGTTDEGRRTVVLDLLELENPYKGLRAFQEADAADFFGREALVERLLGRLAEAEEPRTGTHRVNREPEIRDKRQETEHDGEHAGRRTTDDGQWTTGNGQLTTSRFLAVVGPSGSGKSSLVRAGLVPALRQGRLPGAERWFIVEMLPGAHPLEELEAALLRIAVNPPASLLEQLQQDQRGLLRAIRRVLPENEEIELVLVIDQFEEIFTLVEDEATRVHFLNSLLVALSDPRSRLRVVVTLRADFYDRPLLYGAFGELMRRRTEVVLPLTTDELEQTIVGPARRAGVTLEPDLLAAIVKDVGEQPGALPLLQYALTELFERRAGRVLTLAAYQASGGVLGALARRADELYARLDPAGQEAARQLFLRLVTLGEGSEDTRRRVRMSEIGDWRLEIGGGDSISNLQSPISTVLDLYGRYRLLTFDHDPITRGPTVEVAHEALIRTWGRLRAWLDASRDDLRMQRRLSAAAGEWANAGRDTSFLVSGARLEQFAAWTAETSLALNQEERAYLEASLAERDNQQRQEAARKAREARLERRSRNVLRALVVVLFLGTLGALALTAEAVSRGRAAEQSAATATVAQGQALAEAAKAEQQAELARRNAAAAQNQALVSGAQAALSRGDVDQALTLALTANRMERPGLEARRTLAEAAYAPGTRRRFTGHTAEVWRVVFSPDGRTALSGSLDRTLRLWDVASGQELRRFDGHTAGVYDVALSPDGKLALSASADSTLRLWDVASGQELRRFTGHTDEVLCVTFSSDGRTALSGSYDTTVRLWDVASGKELRRFDGHTAPVQSVVFSPDGKLALSGSQDTTLRLWDVASGQELRRFSGHTSTVQDAAFSPDGQTALSGSADTTVRLWDVASGQELRSFNGHTNSVLGVIFSPDGKLALSGSGDTTIRLWDVTSGQELRRFAADTGVVFGVTFSPDGKRVLAGAEDGTLRLWELANGAELRHFTGHTDSVAVVVFSPDGKTALSGSRDTTVRLWDVASGKELRRFSGHTDKLNDLAFSPDGTIVLSSSWDKTLRLWDVASGKELRRFTADMGVVFGVAFSPDGKTALSGSEDSLLRLWDVASGKELRRFSGHKEIVLSVVFSPDGKTALSGSADGTLRLWEVASGKELRRFDGHSSFVLKVAFSPDGKTALSGSVDKTLRLWDVASGKELRRFTGHSDLVVGVAFSPDGKTALSGSADKTLRLWDLTSGVELHRYVYTAAVGTVAFSPDGRTALSGARDASLILWRIDTLDELIAWTEANRYVPELTCEQRSLYRLEPLCEGPEVTPAPSPAASPTAEP